MQILQNTAWFLAEEAVNIKLQASEFPKQYKSQYIVYEVKQNVFQEAHACMHTFILK